MHILRFAAALLTSPLSLALILGLAAALCGLLRRGRLRNCLAIGAVTLAYLGSLVGVGDLLIRPLEHQYPPLGQTVLAAEIHDVVVLGSGYEPRGGVPASAALDGDGLARIVEGVALARRLSHGRLIVSGGAPNGRAGSVAGYVRLAAELGMNADTTPGLRRALNTAEEARALADLVRTVPFLVVTSAYHMPRAMRLLRREGMRPIAAPTGQLADRNNSDPLRWILPSSAGVARCERALHEYMGLLALATGLV